ncbi:methyltransferase, FxLD system [Patulibacter defluvii]|uniref:methyltransferase, FxLD system n=1 Tax=Patulibacter defluvii TaxID=3095358 RepID=UPI002A761518|nr:methyltransferase, FxLD system [Patulibacter sp. DM4]
MHPASAQLATLRRRLVERLASEGVLTDDAVAAALLRVPRHRFVPGPAAAAYRDAVIATKWDAGGHAISSSSQPGMMAVMLQQLAVAPGQRVLEIGAGTGYNAALLAELCGPGGRVTTVDLDDDLVRGARQHLADAGAERVTVVAGDGALGWPPDAPYDRIELTVATDAVEPAWTAQLAAGGRIVLPLALGAVQRSLALEAAAGGGLVSRSVRDCAFMPLRGARAAGRRSRAPLRAGVALEAPDQRPLDGEALAAALGAPGPAVACGVAVAAHELWGGLALWLATGAGDVGRLLLEPGRPRRAPRPADRGGGLALLGETGFAILERDGRAGAGRIALAARPYGAGAGPLAARLADAVRAWAAGGRPASDEATILVPVAGDGDADERSSGPPRALVRW